MPLRSKPVVRRAVPDDAEVLASLGRGLNVQQGDPSTSFTADAVHRDGFGNPPRFEAWVAELDGKAVGYALVVRPRMKRATRSPACMCRTYSSRPRRGAAESGER
jgi:hypothetical protein